MWQMHTYACMRVQQTHGSHAKQHTSVHKPVLTHTCKRACVLMHYINIPFPYVQTHTNKHSALNLEEEIEIILHCPKWSRISYTVSAHFVFGYEVCLSSERKSSWTTIITLKHTRIGCWVFSMMLGNDNSSNKFYRHKFNKAMCC